MIHRLFTRMTTFDAMFIGAVSTAAYIHTGYVWLVYVICIMSVTSAFRIIADVSTWSDQEASATDEVASQINFLARCIRDRK